MGSIGVLVSAGQRYEDPSKISFLGSLEDVPRGGYEPDEHVRDMDLDGIRGEIIYPSVGLRLFRIPDTGLLSAICRTYNDWLADFCSSYPDRLKGIAMVNVDEVEEGVEELNKAKKLGLVGGMISVYPQEDRQYRNPDYERLWAAAEELDMPLSPHIGTNRPAQGIGLFSVDSAAQTVEARVNIDPPVRMSLAALVFSGVFERYPGLKVVSVEHELAWIPYFIRMLDYVYRERTEQATYRFEGDTLPSMFMRRNVFHSFQEDDLGIQLRNHIGVDTLMWGSDYPHAESTFPRSQEVLKEILAGVPDDECSKIVGGNAARLYHFD